MSNPTSSQFPDLPVGKMALTDSSGNEYTQTNPLPTLAAPLVDSDTVFSVDQSAALEASSIAKASAGVVYKASGRIDSTADTATYYIQLINSATLPVNGAVTMLMAPVKVQHTNGTDSLFDIDLLFAGIYSSAGIVLVASSTEFTKTIITSNWLSATVLYK